ncbi:hypothetical protein D3C72_1281900 [compost metagenome]
MVALDLELTVEQMEPLPTRIELHQPVVACHPLTQPGRHHYDEFQPGAPALLIRGCRPSLIAQRNEPAFQDGAKPGVIQVRQRIVQRAGAQHAIGIRIQPLDMMQLAQPRQFGVIGQRHQRPHVRPEAWQAMPVHQRHAVQTLRHLRLIELNDHGRRGPSPRNLYHRPSCLLRQKRDFKASERNSRKPTVPSHNLSYVKQMLPWNARSGLITPRPCPPLSGSPSALSTPQTLPCRPPAPGRRAGWP